MTQIEETSTPGANIPANISLDNNIPDKSLHEPGLYDVGVTVARFQVNELHPFHLKLLDYMVENHKKTILFLGVSPALGTCENPLDFDTRRRMVAEKYPQITILPLKDVGKNEQWSSLLDDMIRSVYQIETVVMYGGRDSFLPYYVGRFYRRERENRHPPWWRMIAT